MTLQATAIVVGSGRCVWDDLRACRALELDGPVVFAVNDMIALLPPAMAVPHAVSHHPEKLVHWAALRKRRPTTHSSVADNRIDRAWPEYHSPGPSGSSSLLAVRVALALGHPRVIVAGVPLDAQGYLWSDPEGPKFYDFARYRRGWIAAEHELRGRVTAPSGYLAELLGTPAPAAVAA